MVSENKSKFMIHAWINACLIGSQYVYKCKFNYKRPLSLHDDICKDVWFVLSFSIYRVNLLIWWSPDKAWFPHRESHNHRQEGFIWSYWIRCDIILGVHQCRSTCTDDKTSMNAVYRLFPASALDMGLCINLHSTCPNVLRRN